MKEHLKQQKSKNRWLKRPIASQKYRQWLIERGSLTARLKANFNQFSVQSIQLRYARAMVDEHGLLKLGLHQHALIREVMLKGQGQSLVFAHSVLPRASMRGAWNKLGRLGNRPLGEALFANPIVKRTPIEYKKLTARHALFLAATQHLQISPQYLWARRSKFTLNCATILVTEVFLPQILQK